MRGAVNLFHFTIMSGPQIGPVDPDSGAHREHRAFAGLRGTGLLLFLWHEKNNACIRPGSQLVSSTSYMNDFKTELKKWRQRRKLTQSGAAKRMDVSLDTYRNWEQGKNEPAPLTRCLLAEKFFGNGK